MAKRTFTISIAQISLYLCFLIVSILVIIINFLLDNNIFSFFAYLAVLMIITSIPGTARRIRQHHQQASQTIRDKEAEAIHVMSRLKGYSEKDDRKFFLYLRPFISTGNLKIPFKVVSRPVPIESSWFDARPPKMKNETTLTWADLEAILSMALEPQFRLTALGQPGEQVGAGRILSTEETWKGDFSVLSKKSYGIFILASQREGTKWELEEIWKSKELLRKTLFIVPPASSRFLAPSIVDHISIGHTGEFKHMRDVDVQFHEYGSNESDNFGADHFRCEIISYLKTISTSDIRLFKVESNESLMIIKFDSDCNMVFFRDAPYRNNIMNVLTDIATVSTSRKIHIRQLGRSIRRAVRS
jgi:hypothetical protein